MDKSIDRLKVCKRIAIDLADAVCEKFAGNEEIKLAMTPLIKAGAVEGLLATTPLHDRWNTVIIEYAIIDRNEITLDKTMLRNCALERMLTVLERSEELKCKKSSNPVQILHGIAEHAVGKELLHIFSDAAVAAPGKYPIRKTHAHAVMPLGRRKKDQEAE